MSLPHRLFVPTHGGGAGSLTGDDGRFEDLVNYWLARVDDGFTWIGGPPCHVKHLHIPGFEPTGIGALGKHEGNFRHPAFHACTRGAATSVRSCCSRAACRARRRRPSPASSIIVRSTS